MYREDRDSWFFFAQTGFFGSNVLPLSIYASRDGPETARIEFANLAGRTVGSLERVPLTSRLSDLHRRAVEQFPAPSGSYTWRLVLPDGHVVDETNFRVPLARSLDI
mmetsp:Transcript_167441/g.532310  ORF Transcript_167441/g.532310 Transcript_167441/m.532310 type:complete len:107 (-) Transcript_167441:215-535(-)